MPVSSRTSRLAQAAMSSPFLERPPGTPHAVRYTCCTSRTLPSGRSMRQIAPTVNDGVISRTIRRRRNGGRRRNTWSNAVCNRSDTRSG